MHYAEFAEDEVDGYIPIFARNPGADLIAERRAPERNQGIRDQQVEGHRTEGWQAGEGMFVHTPQGYNREKKKHNLTSHSGMRAICQGAFRKQDLIAPPSDAIYNTASPSPSKPRPIFIRACQRTIPL